jgi:hypothetical protein
VNSDAQIGCGFTVSTCSVITSFMLAWMPLLQMVAIIIAIVSGVFAIAVSVTKLIDWYKARK